MSPMTHRGVVEGFYGPAYAHEDRLWLIESMGRWGMNRYLHAPKDDPLHRERWREPYPQAQLEEFRALVARGHEVGVEVGFAVSPGLSIRYGDDEDRDALFAKFLAFQGLGARFFSLALDDVPTSLTHAEDRAAFDSLADAHASLSNGLWDALGHDVTLWMIPTDYSGTASSPYLETLAAKLAPEIEIGWTGRTVVSPTIEPHEAAARAAAVGRRLLVWDNVPVSDGPMRPMLHLGPYVGRGPELAEHLTGILLNPMERARSSAIALRTAADYMNDPTGYDSERSWREATRALGRGAEEAFARFAEAQRFSVLTPDRDRELEAAFEVLRERLEEKGEKRDGSAISEALGAMRAVLASRLASAPEIRSQLADARLRAEIEPWLDAHERESERMQVALDLLEALGDQTRGMASVLAFFRFEGRLTRLPPAAPASYGPRRVLYPQLASLDDERGTFGEEPALFVGHCLADEVIDFVERHGAEQLGARILDRGPE